MRGLFRLVVVIAIIAVVAGYVLGYRVRNGQIEGPTGAVATVDSEKARDAGAAIGDKVATGANAAQKALANASLTGKIKAKMALDDTIKAVAIDVDTLDGVVTLSGTVKSESQRTRALQLARETAGVTAVTDRLRIE